MPGKKRILIVDDHPIVRHGLGSLVSGEDDLEICGEAEDVKSGIKAFRETKPDAVVVDIALEESDGIELIRKIRSVDKSVPVLVLSVYDEKVYAVRSMRAGARGYLMKDKVADSVITALREILAGREYLSEEMKRLVLDSDGEEEYPGLAGLSNRELEIYNLFGRGMTSGDISEKLSISGSTVEFHVGNITRKLGLAGTKELAHHAIAWHQSQFKP